jgi:hypothetical protein
MRHTAPARNSSTLANGAAQLVAVAYDAAGNAGTSGAVSVNVVNGTPPPADTTAPSVTITNPVAGSRVSGMVTVLVTATDDAGSPGITQALRIDGVEVATSTGGSLSYRWNTRKAASGTHTLTATARDAAGNSSSRSLQVIK